MVTGPRTLSVCRLFMSQEKKTDFFSATAEENCVVVILISKLLSPGETVNVENCVVVFQNVPGSLDLTELVMEENMDLANVNTLLELLHSKKKQLEDVSRYPQLSPCSRKYSIVSL